MDIHKDQFLARAMTKAAMPIYMMDRSSKIVWANEAYCKVFSIEEQKVIATICPTFKELSLNKDLNKSIWGMIFKGDTWIGEMTTVLNGEDLIHFQTVVTPLPDQRGNPAFFLVLHQDTTEQRKETDRMWHVAHHDALTGLANRTLFSNLLEHTLLQAKRTREKFAVFFIDLDKFKPVNDTYGHHVGDLLLKHAGEVLKENVREADVVARFGGDEFGVILTSVAGEVGAGGVAGNMIRELCTPVLLEGHTIRFGGSIGIAMYPDDGEDTETLLKAADEAMYMAKDAGRNCYRMKNHEENQC